MATDYPDAQTLESAVRLLLQRYAADPNAESIKDTPKRYIKALDEILTAEKPKLTYFDSNGYDQMIIDSGIPFYSMCEHHMLPFFGTVTIGYLPHKRIIGLSKLARVVDYYSRRLNTQEYLTSNIADELQKELKPRGLGVLISGRHMCKEMRGIKKQGSMTTSALRGIFYDQKVKEEFLTLSKFKPS